MAAAAAGGPPGAKSGRYAPDRRAPRSGGSSGSSSSGTSTPGGGSTPTSKCVTSSTSRTRASSAASSSRSPEGPTNSRRAVMCAEKRGRPSKSAADRTHASLEMPSRNSRRMLKRRKIPVRPATGARVAIASQSTTSRRSGPSSNTHTVPSVVSGPSSRYCGPGPGRTEKKTRFLALCPTSSMTHAGAAAGWTLADHSSAGTSPSRIAGCVPQPRSTHVYCTRARRL